MPVYAYHCLKCGEEFEIIESMSEHGRAKPRCPGCKSPRVERVLGPVMAKTSRKS